MTNDIKQNPFYNILIKLSDRELQVYVDSPENYQKLAVVCALELLSQRGIIQPEASQEELDTDLEDDIDEERIEKIEIVALEKRIVKEVKEIILPETPKEVRLATNILYAAIVVSVISSIILYNSNYYDVMISKMSIARGSKSPFSGEILKMITMAVSIPMMIVSLYLISLIRKGNETVMYVLGAFTLYGLQGGVKMAMEYKLYDSFYILPTTINYLLHAIGFYLLIFNKESKAWFKEIKKCKASR